MDHIRDNPRIGRLLKNVPLLKRLTESERNKLGGALTATKFTPGQIIIKEGDPGHGFFIVNKGEVELTREDGDKTNVLARLKDGDFFGEAALINNAKRGATVAAVTEVECFYLTRDNFLTLFSKDKLNVRFAKRAAISAEKYDAGNEKFESKVPQGAVKEKNSATRDLILKAVRENLLFSNLPADHMRRVIAEMYRAEIKAGVSAIKQGDLGDNIYVVESGEFDIIINGKKVTQRSRGTCFGELALMYNAPRAATVTANQDSVVWVVDRFTFRRIVTELSDARFSQYVAFLNKVDLLAPLASFEREKIAEALEEVSFKSGVKVMRQGEDGSTMYIVHSGSISVYKSENGGEAKKVNTLGPGDYFGERALLKNEARAATCITDGPARLLKLDRNAFSLLLGPLEEVMHEKAEEYEKAPPQEEDRINCETTAKNIPFTNLEVLGTLGKGSFGFVQLVRDKKSKITYALKAVSKAQIVETGQKDHIMSEKRVMARMEHPFLVGLAGTYKDAHRLYFLLEPSLGGELFSVLRARTLFDEPTARFYAASVVLAFEYMHSHDIVYRDLKPENLLLDNEGFLKVTDFGFAKEIKSGRTHTLCGTPDYLAPEIVAGKGHGKGVDWWTLGIFIYEMLASFPPFYDEEVLQIYNKIIEGTITFPAHFSREAVSLITKLLHHKPTRRLGVVKGGAALIKKHPWFRGFDWDALYKRQLRPPIVPRIKNNCDLSNFDDYGSEKQKVARYRDDGTNWDAGF